MHNKLIDRTAYTQIKVSGEKIEDDLIRAIEKLSTIILSHEEKEEIEKQKQIELGLQAIWEHVIDGHFICERQLCAVHPGLYRH